VSGREIRHCGNEKGRSRVFDWACSVKGGELSPNDKMVYLPVDIDVINYLWLKTFGS